MHKQPLRFHWTIIAFAMGLWLLPAWAMAAPIDRLYQKHCGACHGNQGDGRGRAGASLTPPATDFTRADPARLELKTLKQVIREGKPGTAMVAYARRLNEDQIEQLAVYIRQQFIAPAPSPGLVSSVDSATVGKAIYIKHCSACHGDKGSTAVWARNGLNPAPRDFTSPEARKELSRERMLTSVTHGRPGTAMMAFQARLSSREIEQVVDYVRAAFMRAAPPQPRISTPAKGHPSSVDMALPMPKGLSGDVVLGRQFYLNNCFTCHGKQGDGRGPRAHFNRPPPRDFTSEASRSLLNRPRLFQAISEGKRGSVMPAWRHVLTEQQIADVAEYVFQAFIQVEAAVAEKKSLE